MGFLVSQGFGRLLVYPLGLFTFKTFTLKFPFGLLFSMLVRIGRVGFWVSPGFGRLLVYPLGLFTFKTFTFKIPVWAFISMGVGRSCQAWYRFNFLALLYCILI